MNLVMRTLTGFSLCLIQALSFAAEISLTPSKVIANIGDTITVDVIADFTDNATLGGGINFTYDPSKIQYDSFTFRSGASNTLGIEPMVSDVWTSSNGALESIAFGAADFMAGINDAGAVGTITFQAIAGGDTILDISASEDPFKGGSFLAAADFSQQTVSFLDAEIAILGEVPLPAAVWLMLGGLTGLGLFRRKS